MTTIRLSHAGLAGLGLLALLTFACGGSNPSAPAPAPSVVQPTPTPVPTPAPVVPTSWKIRGLIVAATDGHRIPNATLAVDGLAPVTADGAGDYAIETPDAQVRRLLVNADGYLYRETALRGGEARVEVNIDLIPTYGDFLTLYREMARNTWEQPSHPQPTRRWTDNPNIYIETRWRDGGAPVNPAAVERMISEIRRIVPQLSGGRLMAGTIESGPEVRPLTPGWISIHFNHAGNYGQLGANPGEVQIAGDSECSISIAILHELGHAMGYWHNDVPRSRAPDFGDGWRLPGMWSCRLHPLEQLVAQVMSHARPATSSRTAIRRAAWSISVRPTPVPRASSNSGKTSKSSTTELTGENRGYVNSLCGIPCPPCPRGGFCSRNVLTGCWICCQQIDPRHAIGFQGDSCGNASMCWRFAGRMLRVSRTMTVTPRSCRYCIDASSGNGASASACW
jgi:hypothetical protein